jgi:hypothetical protein
MNQAAPQAANGKTADDLALEALRWHWGDAYRIGWDAVRGWWARRRDDLGGGITAETADELYAAISADYALKPVPRTAALPARPDGDDPPPGTVLRDSDDDEPS